MGYRRRNKKGVWVLLIIIGLIGLIWAYNFGYIKIPNIPLKITSNYVSIKDLHQNPEEYVEKNITIKGMLNNRIGGYSLEDNEGYWVWIGEDSLGKGCIEGQRDYDYNFQKYEAIGFLMSPKPCSYICFSFGEGHYYFKCSKPLN